MFGTPAQQAAFLPGLVAGTTVGAYALSESGSGSDALAARTRATRQADGSWRLSGEKMWISNGGFADLFIVFAQADGAQFTAFLVERTFAGVSPGREEHKMGLHGASTTPLLLQDVPVPAGHVLGEIGKGHKVALNTLNYGRFSLGAMCTGGCKAALGAAARYAGERRQFGRTIASFGAIRHKLGEMAARTYAAESVVYRTAGLIDGRLDAEGGARDVARAFEAYAVEASIAKVMGSEAVDFVVDEYVQILGGNGFVRDHGAERAYRDARVNRIFEGTNEINRLLIPGMLVRRGLKGDLPLVAAASRLQDEILGATFNVFDSADAPLEAESRAVSAFKKAGLMVLGTALQTFGDRLSDEQEVLGYAADILIDVYGAESAVLRARQAADAGHGRRARHEAAARVVVSEAALHVEQAARSALAAMADGDPLRTLLAALRRVLRIAPVNTVALRRQLADGLVADGRYVLD
jgi:alkylation response protein AidB-like acyl-CoA dehydrogenase